MASTTYGNYIFSIQDLKVTELDGSPQEDLGAAMKAEFTPEFLTGNLDGDSARKAVVTILIGGKISVGAGSISSAALAIITGITLATSGSTPNEITEHQMDAGDRLPYFKLYAQALDDDAGDIHLLFSKVKLVGGLDFSLAHGNNYVTPGFELEAIDNGTNGIFELIQHETATDVPTS